MAEITPLMRTWEHTPPPAVALRRIAIGLGIEPAEAAQGSTRRAAADPIAEAMASGIPVSSELPDEPMLALIDAPLGASLAGVH